MIVFSWDSSRVRFVVRSAAACSAASMDACAASMRACAAAIRWPSSSTAAERGRGAPPVRQDGGDGSPPRRVRSRCPAGRAVRRRSCETASVAQRSAGELRDTGTRRSADPPTASVPAGRARCPARAVPFGDLGTSTAVGCVVVVAATVPVAGGLPTAVVVVAGAAVLVVGVPGRVPLTRRARHSSPGSRCAPGPRAGAGGGGQSTTGRPVERGLHVGAPDLRRVVGALHLAVADAVVGGTRGCRPSACSRSGRRPTPRW